MMIFIYEKQVLLLRMGHRTDSRQKEGKDFLFNALVLHAGTNSASAPILKGTLNMEHGPHLYNPSGSLGFVCPGNS